MKKFIFSLFALVGMAVSISAQSVSIDNVKVAPGEKAKAILNFTCPADTYTGMQIKVSFPQSFTIATSGAITGWDGLKPYTVDNGVVAMSLAGDVYYSSAAIAVEFTAGDTEGTFPVTVSGRLEGPSASGSIYGNITETTFNVVVEERVVVELDENSEYAPTASDGEVDVKVIRTINAKEWSTICLPFAMTGEQVKDAFGDDVQVAQFESWSITDESPAANNVQSVNLVFATVDATQDGMDALFPYMIKVGSKVDEFNVSNVTILDPEADEFGMGASVSKIFKIKRTDYTLKMNTYYAKSTLLAKEFFVSGNKLWYNAEDDATEILAFRATFTFDNNLTLSFLNGGGSRITMNFVDGETNGINNVKQTGEQNDQYYNLRGLRVETPSKGIYIKNGKKVVVK